MFPLVFPLFMGVVTALAVFLSIGIVEDLTPVLLFHMIVFAIIYYGVFRTSRRIIHKYYEDRERKKSDALREQVLQNRD
mgnify:CR=1 FL=1